MTIQCIPTFFLFPTFNHHHPPPFFCSSLHPFPRRILRLNCCSPFTYTKYLHMHTMMLATRFDFVPVGVVRPFNASIFFPPKLLFGSQSFPPVYVAKCTYGTSSCDELPVITLFWVHRCPSSYRQIYLSPPTLLPSRSVSLIPWTVIVVIHHHPSSRVLCGLLSGFFRRHVYFYPRRQIQFSQLYISIFRPLPTLVVIPFFLLSSFIQTIHGT